MKKIASSLISTALLTAPLLVLAQGGPGQAPTIDVMRMLDSITNWLFSILLIIAAIWLIIAAYYFVTAQGDPDRVSKARNMVLWALIGVLVAFAAKGLVMLIQTIATG